MSGSLGAPVLAALVHRLAECPREFLMEPRIGTAGVVHVDAVATDVVRHMAGPRVTAVDTAVLQRGRKEGAGNHLQLALVACWLLHDDWFAGRRDLGALVLPLLITRLQPLADVVPAAECVTDPDRREELARICLAHFGLRPDGESAEDAQDRLTALDSIERRKVVLEARRAEERARRVREQLARKAAEEAAARYGRE